MRVQFICAAGKNKLIDAGIGHFKRCIKLASIFKEKGYESNFLIFGSNKESISFVNDKLIKKLTFMNFDSFGNEKEINNIILESAEFTFIDISNTFFLKNKKNFYLLLKAARIKTKTLIFIDGLGNESYINTTKNHIEYDFLLAPYFGANKYFKKQKNHLLGPEFFIPEKETYKSKKYIQDVASNICVTCGGTDPENITLKVLKSIFNMNPIKIKLKIIIGPNFYDKHIEEIQKLMNNQLIESKLIFSPQSIKRYIKWSDITIATSGLTKYELLNLGIPSIIIPFNKEQFKLNKESAETGAFLTLNSDKISIELGKKLYSLIKSKDSRAKMSRIALDLIDDKGTQRIINNLEL